jgi:hypothetical protein
MNPFATVRAALEARDCRPKGNEQRGMESRCPAHEDRNPSLSVGLGKGDRVLLKCHAGCSQEDVVDALGLTMADLFERNGDWQIVAAYDYTDKNGELLFQVVRFEPKDFRQRKPDGVGGWEWKLGKTRRALYRLPRIVEAEGRGEDIMVVEGEKDADALHQLGIAATCNPGGAGKWRDEYSETLRGAKVTIVADRDETGRAHAIAVAEALRGVAETVDVLEPAVGNDISDHLAAGKTIAELVEIPPSPNSTERTERSAQSPSTSGIGRSVGDRTVTDANRTLWPSSSGSSTVSTRLWASSGWSASVRWRGRPSWWKSRVCCASRPDR